MNAPSMKKSRSHTSVGRSISNKSTDLIQRTVSIAARQEGAQQVKITVLGAQGVGKTSIIQQFVGQTFGEVYAPTQQSQYYFPSIIVNSHIYEVKIVDCPPIPYFPMSSLTEWAEYRGYCLRSATAYLLVFDVSNEESLQYVKQLREQILDARSDDVLEVPILVVGNKHDLPESSHFSKRDLGNVIKKQWKCAYMECSAKYNWRIIAVFKELMRAIDLIDYTQHRTPADRRQNGHGTCVIL